MFSLSLNMINPVVHRQFKFEESLVKDSRNLRKLVRSDAQKLKLIRKGHIEIVNFLTKLAPSEHEPVSFKLDNCFFSPTMISFSVSGVFKEGRSTDDLRPLRSFHRVFVCIPDTASQMTIINEQFTMCNVTSDQYKAYFSKDEKVVTNEVMIQQFSNESGLTLEWAK